MKQWLTSPGSSCIECSRLFPFSCSTFSKSSFCYEQALGQGHQSQCQCIRVYHTVIPARVPSMENKTRFSLFITELYLRDRVSDHYVSACSRPTGLRLSHGESMIQLPSLLLNAPVLPCGTRNLTISLKCLVQSILAYDNDRPRGYNEFFWMIFFNVDFRCWFSMFFPMLICYVGFQCCF